MSAETTFKISPKPVTVTGITAKNKEYDGTTKAELDFSEVHMDGVLDKDQNTV